MKRYLSFGVISILAAGILVTGCGRDRERETASILLDEDLEILANLNSELGSAQASVEVIPAPPVPVQPVSDAAIMIPEDAMVVAPEVDAVVEAQSVETIVQTPAEVIDPSSVVYNPDPSHSFEQKVQASLMQAGFYDGEIDGKIGSQTREAIKKFQKENNLKADGLAGPKTWAALRDYYYGPDSE